MKKLIFIYLCSLMLIVYNFASTNQHFQLEKKTSASIQKESLEKNFYVRSESSASHTANDFVSIDLAPSIQTDVALIPSFSRLSKITIATCPNHVAAYLNHCNLRI